MDKLLPCPFCGGEAIHDTITMVYCKICFAAALIGKWNTRHTPEGWKLVPVEATSMMLLKGGPETNGGVRGRTFDTQELGRRNASHTWQAMLAAAPKWGGE